MVVSSSPHRSGRHPCCRAAEAIGCALHFDDFKVDEALASEVAGASPPRPAALMDVDAAPPPRSVTVIDRKSIEFSTAAHEISHCWAGYMLGRPINGVQMSPPLAFVTNKYANHVEKIAGLLAGRIGADWIVDRLQLRPEDGFWSFHVAAVREGLHGRCDNCRAVEEAIFALPDADDAAIIKAVREGEALAISLITRDNWTMTIDAAAEELVRRGAIGGHELIEIFDTHRGR